jgi:hypothetical protein
MPDDVPVFASRPFLPDGAESLCGTRTSLREACDAKLRHASHICKIFLCISFHGILSHDQEIRTTAAQRRTRISLAEATPDAPGEDGRDVCDGGVLADCAQRCARGSPRGLPARHASEPHPPPRLGAGGADVRCSANPANVGFLEITGHEKAPDLSGASRCQNYGATALQLLPLL